MVAINASNHDFWSNQFLAGLPAPQGNLGGDGAGNFTGEGAIDIRLFGGDQYFSACGASPDKAIPIPTTSSTGLTMLLAFLLGLGALKLRRQRTETKSSII